MVLTREEVKKDDCWDLTPMYKSREDWQKEFAALPESQKAPYWPSLGKLKGTLGEGATNVKQALDLMFAIDRKIVTLYTWAHLRHDEDIAKEDPKGDHARIMSLYHAFAQEGSWIDPELLALPDDKLQEYMKDPVLKLYAYYIEKLIRMKPHTLTPDNEEILATAGQALSTASQAYSALANADFVFGEVADSTGEMQELTNASYGLFLHDQDRTLRKNTFLKMHEKYSHYENSVAELLNGQVQNHLFEMRVRKYSSCLESALYPKNVPLEVYHTLVDTVNKHLDVLHRYINLRKKALKLDKFHLYDGYVPLVPNKDIKMAYSEGEQAVISSVSPLGSEYQSMLETGLKDQRWVDRFENKNKRSGAYSSGCYDSHPYILMNYKDLLRDVFTLGHEAGHSMHSHLSHQTQEYPYSHYPIFVAEVASTFNEELLFRHLLDKCTDSEERVYLINQKVDDIRATFFRQTMFAEFELAIHTMAEQNEPLTPSALKKLYGDLNRKYFGPDVVFDEHSEMEWARIPHFYYNFYVYQYATGISAALTLAERVRNGGEEERKQYLAFLSSGGSDYPVELLKKAGVDMTKPTAVENTVKIFTNLVDELELALS